MPIEYLIARAARWYGIDYLEMTRRPYADIERAIAWQNIEAVAERMIKAGKA